MLMVIVSIVIKHNMKQAGKKPLLAGGMITETEHIQRTNGNI